MNKVDSNKKIVYIPMCADIVHAGHLNIIKEGQKIGSVTVGLLTDEAVASKNRLPFMDYQQRLEVISNIKGVDNVIPQTTPDYRPNLRKLKPDFVVHGNDWRKEAKQQVVDTIAEWGGKLVELEYTEGISSTALHKKLKSIGISPVARLSRLEQLLKAKKTIRALEAHNGISALIVENIQSKDANGVAAEFDAIWVSSLTDSIAKGKPDTELIDRTSRIATINEILEVTTKPLIVDGDTGGHVEHFTHTVRTLERLGVSAIVIEDKNGLKRNSLHDKPEDHKQEDPDVFAAKIKAGIDARVHEQFMIIARIESLILGKGQDDALHRAQTYLNAGASAIMIHSKDESGADVQKFAEAYNKLEHRKPLMMVPTSYNKITESQLSSWGANIIVYANHLLRAAYPAMEHAAQSILENQRASETESSNISIEKFLKLVPGS
jgi:phosphoenolpyruvate phosphomutase / 2-hydroxyethylphosphonate cytidylyltransferase